MDAALLAPVPEVHLLDGLTTVRFYGKAAYGSRSWEVFRDLDQLRGDEPPVAYLYASHVAQNVGPKVTWEALHIGHIEARSGSYPGNLKYRPTSATEHPADLAGHRAVYWHLADLKQLPREDWVDIADIRRYRTQMPFGKGFVPEGPIIVGNP
jgi:hypothetical protein